MRPPARSAPPTTTPTRLCVVLGASLVASGIALGAFAAHALRIVLDVERLGWWQTGVQYQMWNGLGLCALASLLRRPMPAVLIACGTLVFSASLYAMALSGLRWLGAVTPVGGLLMIAGWLAVVVVTARRLPDPGDAPLIPEEFRR